MAGDWTSQKFLGSMEGAVLGGKLAAEVVSNRAVGNPDKEVKEIQNHIVQSTATLSPRDPVGVRGEGAIAFGAGAVLGGMNEDLLRTVDPVQFVDTANVA